MSDEQGFMAFKPQSIVCSICEETVPIFGIIRIMDKPICNPCYASGLLWAIKQAHKHNFVPAETVAESSTGHGSVRTSRSSCSKSGGHGDGR